MSVGTFDARLFHTQDGEWQVIDWRSRVQDPVLRSGVGNARKRSRRKQRGNWKDSTRQTESSDRDARATRRVVGKRLTPWRRPAPPDAAHAPCLKELAHPSSQCRLKTTVTSSFLTRNLWNPSSLCSLYQTFFSPLSPLSLSLSFTFTISPIFLPFSLSLSFFSFLFSSTLSLRLSSSSLVCVLFSSFLSRFDDVPLSVPPRPEFSMLIPPLLLISSSIVTRPIRKDRKNNKATGPSVQLLFHLSRILRWRDRRRKNSERDERSFSKRRRSKSKSKFKMMEID